MLLPALAGGALGLINLFKPSTPKLPAPLPQPQRDDAPAAVRDEDGLRKRRGGAADIMTGSAGAEAPAAATGKDTLGS